jgi:2-polyprenyl-3-methyl-5-hydroxy-6-metoxy-1,4-benzoquinol methylase
MTEPHSMWRDRWARDPRLLGIMLARYKFVGKMFEGKAQVLEVGCNDGFGSRVVRQHVQNLTCVDCDAAILDVARRDGSEQWPIRFQCEDFMVRSFLGFDAVYCLDVFEHLADEQTLLHNLRQCAPVCIIGTPSLESQRFATDGPAVHVNCKSAPDLKAAMLRHWSQVFLFGMNDETLHTGFAPMSHYLLALGVA